MTKTRGKLVAAILSGAWRAEPPALTCTSEELAAVAPLLLGSGAAPLGWWKVRATHLSEGEDDAAASGLRAAYRSQVLQNAVREREIEDVFGRLREAGVEALLVKGWAAARAYPAEGLRPFGDIDVCVRPGQVARAAAAIEQSEARLWVDLHDGFATLDDRDFAELFARAETLRVGATDVRVPGAEDHLRILCVHLLKHGAWRPLWLCDVAAMLEGRGAGFDWEHLLGRNERRARWVTCAVGLAHKLLGARIANTPLAGAAGQLPRWLVPEVLKQWDAPYATRQAPMRYRAPMRAYLRRPAGALADLRNRWPNPIEATIRVGGAFNDLPRWPFQLANCLTRAAGLFAPRRRTASR